DLAAEVGLARPTEFAFSAFGSARESSTRKKEHVISDILESNDIVAGFHCGDALADRLNNACAFVSEYDWERPFRIFARQRVRICELMSNENKSPPQLRPHQYGRHQCSIFLSGPRGSLVEQLRHPQSIGLFQLRTQLQPFL